MTARFAGSKSLDGRRRRRLATESDDVVSVQSGRGSTDGGGEESGELAPVPTRATQLPLRRVVSPRRWKLWTLGVTFLSLLGGLLWATWRVSQTPESAGPGATQMLSLSSSRVFDTLGGVLFLLAGQLAILIRAVRGMSLRDFDGRYRNWGWAAAVALVVAFCMATDAHVAAVQTVFWLWPSDLWQKEVLCWLIPVASWGLVMIAGMHRDMRDNKPALTLLWLAVTGWCVVIAARLAPGLPAAVGLPAPLDQIAVIGVGLFAHLCLFQAMLLHTRHVIYETADPPANRKPWLRLIVERLPRLRLPRRRPRTERSAEAADRGSEKPKQKPLPATTTASKSDDAKPEPEQLAAKKAPARRKTTRTTKAAAPRTAKPAGKPKAKQAAKPAARPPAELEPTEAEKSTGAPERPAASTAKGGSGNAAASKPKPAHTPLPPKPSEDSADVVPMQSQTAQEDGPDPELLKGLSKKERRRMRKQWRDEQRQDRRAA